MRLSDVFQIRSPIYLAARSGHSLCVEILFRWIEIETNASGQNTDCERILENVTLCAMTASYDQVLKILPRLSSTNVKNVLRVLGGQDLLFASIEWGHAIGNRKDTSTEALAEFFLRTYTFDLSIRDASGANALILAARRDMAHVVRMILEQRKDLLNSQDYSGRTPLSWATEGTMTPVSVLLGYESIQAGLVDSEGLAPIDYALRNSSFTQSDVTILPLMVTSLEHGINWIDRDGYSLLHVLIELSYHRQVFSYAETREDWEKLKRYKEHKIFARREDWAEFDNIGLNSLHPCVLDRYLPRVHVSVFRTALGTGSASAAEIRSSPCKCGVGTIFLAIANENLEVVEALLDFYPDLVNDQFTDGSSPLDLASCILNKRIRRSMIKLILSKNPAVKTCRADSPRSGTDESDSGEAQRGCIFTDIQVQEDTQETKQAIQNPHPGQ